MFFIALAGISLSGDTVDNQRSCGAKIAGSDLVDLKPDRCVALRTQR